MKFRIAHFFLLIVLLGMGAFLSGCSSTEPENEAVRPWDSPEGWQGGALGDMMNDQHR